LVTSLSSAPLGSDRLAPRRTDRLPRRRPLCARGSVCAGNPSGRRRCERL